MVILGAVALTLLGIICISLIRDTVKDEKSFRAAAEAKFKKVFGDNVDEDKMNGVIDGILKKYKSDADNGDWGKLIGVLNKSF